MLAGRVLDLSQQEGTAVSQLRNEVSELMAGIGHGHGIGTLGDTIAGQYGGPFGRIQAESPSAAQSAWLNTINAGSTTGAGVVLT